MFVINEDGTVTLFLGRETKQLSPVLSTIFLDGVRDSFLRGETDTWDSAEHVRLAMEGVYLV